MPTLNLGIVAHVDAGKTTLTERLLFETGVIATAGRVDHGDTVTDADDIERRRGITIRSAVVTFHLDDVKVNLIDTPGHSDFVAEVERAVAVLDGAVLVVSAVEGVQAQTRVLIRILERLRIPFVVFVNKIDRVGASYDKSLVALDEALAGATLLVTAPTSPGSRAASVFRRAAADLGGDLLEVLAETDESWLTRYVDGGSALDDQEAWDALARLTSTGRIHPAYVGAALVGTGVAELMHDLSRIFSTSATTPADPDGPLHASVFAITRATGGQHVALARMRGGRLEPRTQVSYWRAAPGSEPQRLSGRISAVRTFDKGSAAVAAPARAGDIAAVVGLTDIAIGDQLGRWDPAVSGRQFRPPGLEAVVVPRRAGDRAALFAALRLLSAQDPLIDARLEGLDEELTVSLYGEVQKEVLLARLAEEFGVDAEFLPTATVCVERVAGTGESVEAVNGRNAVMGLRVEEGPVDSGLTYRLEVERGWLLPSYHTAIEETLRKELSRGLYGWRVADARVALIAAHFQAPTPPAGYFRQLTSTTFQRALAGAGTVVCEPFSDFEADVPADALSSVLGWLLAARAVPDEPQLRPARCRVNGVLPTSEVDGVERRLPALTAGRGSFSATPAGFRPIDGRPPVRGRAPTVSPS